MDYQDFIDEVEELDFIPERETAEAAVKAVLGIIFMHIDEGLARKLSDLLHEPVALEKLGSHRTKAVPVSFDQFISEISALFRIDKDQSRQIIEAVLYIAKTVLGDGEFEVIRETMPGDWTDFLMKV
jgi:uncharacterized protein (DUF2267 family)